MTACWEDHWIFKLRKTYWAFRRLKNRLQFLSLHDSCNYTSFPRNPKQSRQSCAICNCVVYPVQIAFNAPRILSWKRALPISVHLASIYNQNGKKRFVFCFLSALVIRCPVHLMEPCPLHPIVSGALYGAVSAACDRGRCGSSLWRRVRRILWRRAQCIL